MDSAKQAISPDVSCVSGAFGVSASGASGVFGDNMKNPIDLEDTIINTEPASTGPPSTGGDSLRADLAFRWRGENYRFHNVNLRTTSINDLREMIEDSTLVLAEHQKLLGLTKQSLKNLGNAMLSDLQLKIKDGCCSFSLMGTPESEIIEMHEQAAAMQSTNTVFDDLSFGLSNNTEEWQKLQTYTASTEIHFMHEPRPGKSLLVLDLDHTIVHFTSKENVPIEEQKRPFMEKFLTEVYAHYDIAIWSQTRWHWIEIKMNEMNMFHNPNYKVCFMLDKTSMFNSSRGKVKPLHLIWSKFPSLWGKHNTLHVDDLVRNFQLNPTNGIVIRPFNRARSSASSSASSALTADQAAAPASLPAAAGEVAPVLDVDLYVLSR